MSDMNNAMGLEKPVETTVTVEKKEPGGKADVTEVNNVSVLRRRYTFTTLFTLYVTAAAGVSHSFFFILLWCLVFLIF